MYDKLWDEDPEIQRIKAEAEAKGKAKGEVEGEGGSIAGDDRRHC